MVTSRGTVFSTDGLERLEGYDGYLTAAPFPHLVLDDLFDPDALNAVIHEWPLKDETLERHDDGTFVRSKLATTWRTQFGQKTSVLFEELAAPPFLLMLQRVTSMWGLMGDPYMFGGGLHATGAGGKLAVHADFNKHPIFALERRLNMLVFLNHEWKDENGGWLELWDKEMLACQKRVLPTFNRTVIFSTNSWSFHGQPQPVVGGPDLWRKSIALYYYSNGRADEGAPPDQSGSHSTIWRERPEAGF